MNKQLFTALIFAGVTTISGCVSAGDLAFDDNTDNILLNEASNINTFMKYYGDCLIVKSLQEEIENGKYSISTVKKTCAPLGRKYFEAVYADASKKHSKIRGNEVFSRNTAKAVVQEFETEAFKRIEVENRKSLR